MILKSDQEKHLLNENKFSDQNEKESFQNQAKIIYFLIGSGFSFWLKYSPTYLNTFSSLNPKQIGIIQTTTWSSKILVIPFWSIIQDSFKKPNVILPIQFMGFPLFYCILQFVIGHDATYTQIFVCNILALVLYEGAQPTIDGLILDRLQDKNSLGKVKFTYSIAMVSCGTFYGILASFNGFSYAILLMSLVYIALSIFVIQRQPFFYTKKSEENIFESLKILFQTQEIIHLYSISMIFWGFMFLVDNFAFLYYVREFNVSMAFIGICLLCQKVPEVFINYYSDLTINYCGLEGLRIIALFVLSIRFALYSMLTKETIYLAWACESLHGFSLANFSLSVIIGIKKYAPQQLIATSQSFGQIFSSFGFIIGGLSGSYYYDQNGGQKLFSQASYILFIVSILYSIYLRYINLLQRHNQQEMIENNIKQNIELNQIQ